MPNQKTSKESVQTSPKVRKNYKQAWETTKTVMIFVLITGIVAFIGGMQYQKGQVTTPVAVQSK